MGPRNRSRAAFGLTAFMMMALVMVGAGAAGPPTIPLGTLTAYSVVGASTVTNTGNSTLNGGVGLWPGTSVTGFPPGTAAAIDAANPAALQAQTDLTAAYLNAAGRAATGIVTDLGGMTLTGGVYAGDTLNLTGILTLDGADDPGSVFIFQTVSTLITGSGSAVVLVNGAAGCNVFWQVGSSATLGTGSSFTGTVLALTSVTVTTGVTVSGRVLAQTGAVTLDSDTFVQPSCDLAPPVTTTSGPPATTTSTTPPTTTVTTPPITTTTAPPTTTTVPVTTTTAVTTTTRPVPTTVPTTTTRPVTTVPPTTSTQTTIPPTTVPTVTSPTTTRTVPQTTATSGTTTTHEIAATTTTLGPVLGDTRPVAPILIVIVGGTLGLLLGCLAVFARNRLG